jgi:chloride channel protein, CIC family
MLGHARPHARSQELADFTTQPRVLVLSAMALACGTFGVISAWVLLRLIALFTNIAYYGEVSTRTGLISLSTWGDWSILLPVGGSIIVGLMARYGTTGSRKRWRRF